MEDSQHQPRVAVETPQGRPADESRARQESTTAALARLLANPRRTRRA